MSENNRPERIHGLRVSEFVSGYTACMLWSSTGENGNPLDRDFDTDDLAAETVDRIDADCRSFLYQIGYLITDDNFTGRADGSLESRAGHDFWLTRCGHGAGFWDGDWTGENPTAGDQLDKVAKAFGDIDPYIGDDGSVYLA